MIGFAYTFVIPSDRFVPRYRIIPDNLEFFPKTTCDCVALIAVMP